METHAMNRHKSVKRGGNGQNALQARFDGRRDVPGE
jgi:hypothetical protein